MQDELVFYHITKGNLHELVGYSADSARVLRKYGADRFESACSEVIYFLYAVGYHTVMLGRRHDKVLITDKDTAIKGEAEGFSGFGESFRPDVMATAFEFDSVLICARSMFDRLVRVLETPLSQDLPQSIRNFARKGVPLLDHPICGELTEAWEEWGQQAANYRDCLVHFWTFHQGTYGIFSSTEERQLLIPDNPEVRSRAKFSYDRKVMLVDYASEIKRKSESLVESIFEQVFESLIAEEFGDRVRCAYWNDVPLVDSQQIKGHHEVRLSPGIAWDARGKITRFGRRVVAENGKTQIVLDLPVEWQKQAKYPVTIIESTESSLTELFVALQKMADKERRG